MGLRYDSQGNVVDPKDLKKVNEAEYQRWQNAPLFDSGATQTPAPPTTHPVPYDYNLIERHNKIGEALMKQNALEEQTAIQQRAAEKEQMKNRSGAALSSYNKMTGNPYEQQPVQPGKVSDEEAALLASEFTKQPPRFKGIKKSMGR